MSDECTRPRCQSERARLDAMLLESRRRISALEAENERLQFNLKTEEMGNHRNAEALAEARDALKPFAKMATHAEDSIHYGPRCKEGCYSDLPILWDDLRRARSILTKASTCKEGTGDGTS